MNNKENISIMIVDDHAVVRLGLRSLLEKEENYVVCCEAESVNEAYEKIETFSPDLILLDHKLPDGDGISACRQIKIINSKIKIIIITAFVDDLLIKEAILAGADGYLLKSIDRKAIISAIEKVLLGIPSIDPTMIKNIINIVDIKPLEVELKTQDNEILKLVAKGMTNKEIGKELFIAEKTVRNYLSRIMKKIEVNNRTEAALYWINQQK